MIEQTMTMLEEIFATHQKIMLWVSGGKDSLTLMHLCRPWHERLILLHNAVDGGFEGVWENLKASAVTSGFHEPFRTTPSLSYDAYVQQYGWPVDVVPTAMDGVMPTPYANGEKVSSWWFCTWKRQIEPLMRMTHFLQPDAVLTGSKATDGPFFAKHGAVMPATDVPWIRYNPLHAWTSEQVYAYIEAEGLSLPPHYAQKRDATFEYPDCQMCTWQPKYLGWMQKNRPEQYAALMDKFKPTLETLRGHIYIYDALLGESDG